MPAGTPVTNAFVIVNPNCVRPFVPARNIRIRNLTLNRLFVIVGTVIEHVVPMLVNADDAAARPLLLLLMMATGMIGTLRPVRVFVPPDVFALLLVIVILAELLNGLPVGRAVVWFEFEDANVTAVLAKSSAANVRCNMIGLPLGRTVGLTLDR